MVQHVFQLGKAKKNALVEKCKGPWQRHICYNNFFKDLLSGEMKMKPRKDKRIVKLEFFFFQKCSFKHILKKSAHSLFDAWSFLSVPIWFTPSEGPQGFVNWFLKKSGPWRSDHGKKPSSMVRLHAPSCKPANSWWGIAIELQIQGWRSHGEDAEGVDNWSERGKRRGLWGGEG